MGVYQKLSRLDDLEIVILDDDKDLLFMIEQLLETVGAKVRAFEDATSALAAIAEHAPDIIISDWDMPDCDGFAFMRRVRSLPDARRRIPAIMLSAHATAPYRNGAMAAGFDAHLAKPMRANNLIETIERVVANTSAPS